MRAFYSAIFALTVIFLAASSRADTVRMKNGDQVTGEIIKFEGSELFFDSDVMDEIKIDLADIESIETTKPVRIEFDDGTETTGYIVRAPDGQMRLQEAPPPSEYAEASVEEPATEDEPSGTPVALATVYHIEEAKTYFNYTASIDMGLNAAKGNSDSTNFAASWDVQPSFGKNHLRTKGQINRAEADGEKTASNWRANQTYERDLTRKWLLTGLLNSDHDSLQELDLRTTVGAGAGYKFLDNDTTFLKGTLAPAYVHENYKVDDDEDYAAMLWLLEFDQDLWSDDVEFYHDHKLTAALTQSGVIVLTTTGLKFDLIDDFDLLLELQYDWNSEPADDADESDQRYLVKLGYTFAGDENNWWH